MNETWRACGGGVGACGAGGRAVRVRGADVGVCVRVVRAGVRGADVGVCVRVVRAAGRNTVVGMPLNEMILDNPKAERVRRMRELTQTKGRRKHGRFLAEGPQAVREAVRFAPGAVRDLVVALDDGSTMGRRNAILESEALDAGIYVHHADAKVVTHVSPDCQGILAVVDASAVGADASQLPSGGMVAAFWQVRDPGNAGAVIRAADAAGCSAVVFVDDCVDALSPKVVRSTAGSLFHLPVAHMGEDEFFDWVHRTGRGAVAADVYGTQARPVVDLPDAVASPDARAWLSGAGFAVLFGNEARGLEPGTVDRCDMAVRIPIYGKAESLNLATSAAVMLYSFAMSR